MCLPSRAVVTREAPGGPRFHQLVRLGWKPTLTSAAPCSVCCSDACYIAAGTGNARPRQCSNEVAAAPLYPSNTLLGHPREQWQHAQQLFATLALQRGLPRRTPDTHLLEQTIHPAHVWLLSGTSAHFATDLPTPQPRAQTFSTCCAGRIDWKQCAARHITQALLAHATCAACICIDACTAARTLPTPSGQTVMQSLY